MTTGATDANGRARNRWRAAVWGTAACLLLLPLAAMRSTDQARWDGVDFVVAGAVLLAACGAYEFAVWRARSSGCRLAFAIAIATGVLAARVNLAVGMAVGMVVGEDDPSNLRFGGVLAVACIGALPARLRARHVARAALVQAALVLAAPCSWRWSAAGTRAARR